MTCEIEGCEEPATEFIEINHDDGLNVCSEHYEEHMNNL